MPGLYKYLGRYEGLSSFLKFSEIYNMTLDRDDDDDDEGTKVNVKVTLGKGLHEVLREA
jgi:hypothetical protein